MISIDTNILVRHLTEDDLKQLKAVHLLFKKNEGAGEIFISLIVLVELNWVLLKCYDWDTDKFCDAVEDILRCLQFNVENNLAVKLAISRCRNKQDFADALIGQVGAIKNSKTYTFDKKLKNDSAFVVLGV